MATVVGTQIIPRQQRQPTRKDYMYQALSQALQSMVGGMLQGQERRRQSTDVEAFAKYQQYQQQLSQAEGLQQALMGMAPEQRGQLPQDFAGPQWPVHQPSPQMQSRMGQQMAMKLMDPMAGLQAENLRARTAATKALTTQRHRAVFLTNYKKASD